MDSKYLHIYKGCFHRDAKESNVSYFRGCLIYYTSLLSPLGQQTFFEGGASIRVGVSLLHRRRAIGWYAFGVAWLSSGRVGIF